MNQNKLRDAAAYLRLKWAQIEDRIPALLYLADLYHLRWVGVTVTGRELPSLEPVDLTDYRVDSEVPFGNLSCADCVTLDVIFKTYYELSLKTILVIVAQDQVSSLEEVFAKIEDRELAAALLETARDHISSIRQLREVGLAD